MNRKPSHLADANAAVFNSPSYNADNVLQGTLSRVGNEVRDGEGGKSLSNFLLTLSKDGLMLETT